jgi:hypothetical protein
MSRVAYTMLNHRTGVEGPIALLALHNQAVGLAARYIYIGMHKFSINLVAASKFWASER